MHPAHPVRVSFCAGTRRVDVTLPEAVPVAELVPGLASQLGVVGSARLLTTAGSELDANQGLAEQGVVDGQLLHLVPGPVPPPSRYDDLAEALADVVQRTPTTRRRSGPFGALLVAAGFVVVAVTWTPRPLIASVLTALVGVAALASTAAPAVSLAVAGISPPWPDEPVTEVDVDRLTDDAALARRVLVALTMSVGLLPGLTAPFAVTLGAAGAAVCLAGTALAMLRARRCCPGAVADAGTTSGIASLTSVVLSMLLLQESWRVPVAVALIAAGVIAACAPTLRTGRVADLAETGCIVSIPPLLLVVSGLLDGLLDRLPG